MKINKRIAAILACGLIATTVFAQVGVDRMVNAYSLITNTWATFNVTTLTAANIDITGGLTVGAGESFEKILSAATTLDYAAVPTNQIAILTITVAGAGTNGVPFLNIVTPNTNCTYTATIEATNTVTVRAANISLNDIANHAVTSARVIVFQP